MAVYAFKMSKEDLEYDINATLTLGGIFFGTAVA